MKPAALKIIPVALPLLALAACAMGPDYVKPSAPTPAGYKQAGDWLHAQPQDSIARGPWWQAFKDPLLDQLEQQVDISNQTLAQAEAQYRQAQALVLSARAGYLPTLSAGASATRSHSGSGSPSGSSGSATGGRSGDNFSLSLDASWEPDLWGRVRRTVEANEADASASAADLASARLSTQAQLAQDYFQLRVLDEQRRLLDETVAGYQRSLQLTQNQYAAGVAARADVVQAQTQLKTAQAQAIDSGIQRAQLEHAIAVLIGKPPADFSIAPAPLLAIIPPPSPPGVPSSLLQRRPDIAAAERRMAAANAQIGVAETAYFPDLTLSASGGYQGNSFADWISLPYRFWSVGPSLAMTLFNGGARKAQTDQAIAAYDQTVASYRQTVLTAFQDVEDTLVQLQLLAQEAQVQDQAVAAAQESVKIATNQYQAGLVSYLNVVSAQNAAYGTRRGALNVLGSRLGASVLLIKALGGDWAGTDTRK
ncbi:MAG TPA: efflux transporter outer membrane subunit [Stenotrophobium sp.]|nr:efflux transporter outer membrane subunit [Stenotrophobium sp.]